MTRPSKAAQKALPQQSHKTSAMVDAAPHGNIHIDGKKSPPPLSVAERILTPTIAVSSVVVTLGAAILYLIGSVGYPAYVDGLGVPTGPFPLDAEMLIVWGLHIGTLVLGEAIFLIATIIAFVGVILIPLWRSLDSTTQSSASRPKLLAEQSWQARYLAPIILHLSIVMTLFGTSIFALLCISLLSGTSSDKGKQLAKATLERQFAACTPDDRCQTYVFSGGTYVGRALLSNERLMAVAVPATGKIEIVDLVSAGQRLMSIDRPRSNNPASEKATS